MTARIEPIDFDSELFAPLLADAGAEGLALLARLRDEWLSGALRFERSGEILLGVWGAGKLIGVGGVSLDPYAPEARLGRVRHVYVRPGARGRGIGAALIDRLVAHSRAHFAWLRLRAQPRSAPLYERLGFEPYAAPDATHRLIFDERRPS